MSWLPDILYFFSPNKVSYNISIWKMRIQKVGVIWQNIKLHLFFQISMTFRHGPASGCQFLIEVMPGLMVRTRKYIFPSL